MIPFGTKVSSKISALVHCHCEQGSLTKMTKLDVLSWEDITETRMFTSVVCLARRTTKDNVPPVFHDRCTKEQKVVIRCFNNSTPK